jgi:flagellar biosynthesis protein FlhB
MSEGADEDTEKEHAPTQKRLNDARQRGEVAQSPDLIAAASLAGFVLACIAVGGASLQSAGANALIMIERADQIMQSHKESGEMIFSTLALAMIAPLLPLVLLPFGTAIVALIATKSIVFSTDKIMPKASRISILSTAKQKFGLDGLFEFAKSAVKLVIMSLVCFVFLQLHLPDVMGSLSLQSVGVVSLLMGMIIDFLSVALVIAVVIGGLDFFWQVYRHQQRNRMSRQELTDEMKESEGDPHIKWQRRQRGQEIATNRMLADVPNADVVIVNPTHYAVALKWKRGAKTAPICVAKGVDEVAAQIRARAAENGVPIHSDPPTARAIYATIDIGAPIRTEHFKAVAAAIRFAEAMRLKARKTWRTA